jgi:tripartite-type tricarboxylate transporter receptor subunit TctC
MTDLLSGQIPVLFATLSTTLQYIDSGKIKVLGVVEDKRSTRRPEIPTINEVMPGFVMPITWLGFLGPAGMPAALTQKMHAEIVRAMTAPDVRKQLEASGFDVVWSKSPEEFTGLLRSGLEDYRKIKTQAHMQAE